MENKYIDALSGLQKIYKETKFKLVVGYSGGKDSSLIIKMIFDLYKEQKAMSKSTDIFYCDTGVEIPIINEFIQEARNQFEYEIDLHSLPIKFHVVRPTVENTFFSKVIGKGYPTPTNKFRWCTRRLRINPIRNFLKNKQVDKICMLLGIRKSESIERDRIIDKHRIDDKYFINSDYPESLLYYPILNFNANDVWRSLLYEKKQFDGLFYKLLDLYIAGNGQIGNTVLGFPANCRFGCWTCTVVRKDKTSENLIKAGYTCLEPLFEFRNWLSVIRDNNDYRWKKRRNGQIGLGPFIVDKRREILNRLLTAQKKSGFSLISTEEIKYCETIWYDDELIEDQHL